MLGFPGEDYTTPQTIEKTGGFGDPGHAPERLERFKWALDTDEGTGARRHHAARRVHPGGRRPRREPFLDTLAQVGDLATAAGVTVRSRRVRSRPPCCAARSTT